MRTLYFTHELEEQFEDYLNEAYEPVSICGCLYDAGRAYRLVDEYTFNCDFNVYLAENYTELFGDDITPEERKHYILNDRQTVYCVQED